MPSHGCMRPDVSLFERILLWFMVAAFSIPFAIAFATTSLALAYAFAVSSSLDVIRGALERLVHAARGRSGKGVPVPAAAKSLRRLRSRALLVLRM